MSGKSLPWNKFKENRPFFFLLVYELVLTPPPPPKLTQKSLYLPNKEEND
jgi:hypothetical protein